jgi:hypothetical protein
MSAAICFGVLIASDPVLGDRSLATFELPRGLEPPATAVAVPIPRRGTPSLVKFARDPDAPAARDRVGRPLFEYRAADPREFLREPVCRAHRCGSCGDDRFAVLFGVGTTCARCLVAQAQAGARTSKTPVRAAVVAGY